MISIFKKTLILSSVILFFSINGGCTSKADTNSFKKELSAAVSDLYLGKHGKDYPYEKSALDLCLKDQYQPCLKVYETVENAKKMILSIPKNVALPTVLNMIQESCNSEDEIQANYVCHGSIMALYFYNNVEDDNQILPKIKTYPKSVRDIIFNNDFAWFQNRANKNDWVNYLTSEDISWNYEGSKEETIKKFLSYPTSAPLWSKR
ncbi:MAG: hypothetical protein GY799_21690 [Desulfobulbaceae bacterium]|nr:hypothetical protein [Desulfobulbaceae bacterium]